jgi:hypothetical protein
VRRDSRNRKRNVRPVWTARLDALRLRLPLLNAPRAAPVCLRIEPVNPFAIRAEPELFNKAQGSRFA